MLEKTLLKQQIAGSLDAASAELVAFGTDIFEHAELGFREHRTAARVADAMPANCDGRGLPPPG